MYYELPNSITDLPNSYDFLLPIFHIIICTNRLSSRFELIYMTYIDNTLYGKTFEEEFLQLEWKMNIHRKTFVVAVSLPKLNVCS